MSNKAYRQTSEEAISYLIRRGKSLNHVGTSVASTEPLLSRSRALISESNNIEDPFELGDPSPQFTLKPKDFLRMAGKFPPRNPHNTVSGFTDWVYSLYQPKPDAEMLEYGLKIESHIFRKRHEAFKSKSIRTNPSGEWELLHNGLHGCEVECNSDSYFTIPELAIQGNPLCASPDLVFKNKTSGAIVIIEIKSCNYVVPTNLWPNVWAQLWAYSRIPAFVIAPSVTVVGEVWGENFLPYSRNISEYEYDSIGLFEDIYLRRLVKRNPREALFSRFFAALFEIYRS